MPTWERRKNKMLTVENLSVSYGRVTALKEVSFRLERGQIVSIIGSNGAGKTTLLNAISGMVKYNGKVSFESKPLTSEPHKTVKEGIVQVPEGRKIFAGLTVEENLRVGAYLNSSGKEVEKMMEEQFEIFPILKERRRQHGGMLSGGEQQMLAIARGVMSKPKLLLLDEPSLGLAPKIVATIFKIIQDIRDKGITVLLVEQNATKALSIADYGFVLENGKITNSGRGIILRTTHVLQRLTLELKGENNILKEGGHQVMTTLLDTTVGMLKVKVYDTNDAMGLAAAENAASLLNKYIGEKGSVNAIFAAAPSQNTFLFHLLKQDIDWTKVNAYHMDEYIGLDAAAPQGFGNFLNEAIFSRVPFASIN
jgi:branched-chain amino acid transport system ATP-binding protein